MKGFMRNYFWLAKKIGTLKIKNYYNIRKTPIGTRMGRMRISNDVYK